MLVVHIHLASFSAREEATRQRAFGWSARRRIWIRLSRVPTVELASGTYAMQMARLKIIKKRNLLALVLKRASYEARRCFTSSKYSYSTRCNVATRDELRNRQVKPTEERAPMGRPWRRGLSSIHANATRPARRARRGPEARRTVQPDAPACRRSRNTHTAPHPRPEPAGRTAWRQAMHTYEGSNSTSVPVAGFMPRSGREY